MDEVDRWLAAAGISILDTLPAPLPTLPPKSSSRSVILGGSEIARLRAPRGAGVGFDASIASTLNATKSAPVGIAGEAANAALEAAVRRGQKRRADEEDDTSRTGGGGSGSGRGRGRGRGSSRGRGGGGGGGGAR